MNWEQRFDRLLEIFGAYLRENSDHSDVNCLRDFMRDPEIGESRSELVTRIMAAVETRRSE